MRRAVLVGSMFVATILVFSLLQVAAVGANSSNAPALQDTATATAEGDMATATAGTMETATAGTMETATTGAMMETATTGMMDGTATVGSLTNLPNTGQGSASPAVIIVSMILGIVGIAAVAFLLTSRRGARA